MELVDVGIQIYGKPHQTAVTLLSLLKHSQKWIDKIYFIVESRQPPGSDFSVLTSLLRDRLITFTPKFYLGYGQTRFMLPWAFWKPLRHSFRYQYAWEHTNKNYLFLTHNDVLYTDDCVGYFMKQIGSHIGVGQVGQCWNCPAKTAGKCDSTRYLEYRPDAEQFLQLLNGFKRCRGKRFYKKNFHRNVWPLPECRINEWACLINMKQARAVTMPKGKCAPFGAFSVDIGTEWFHQVHQLGFTAAHADLSNYCKHAWASPTENGHSADLNKDLYDHSEHLAKNLLKTDYGLF